MAEPTDDIDYSALAGLSQEEVNKRLLAAMLQQGSAKYDQAMLADTLARSREAKPLGPRGRGFVGELNDFATAFRPGMERSRAQLLVEELRKRDKKTMKDIIGPGSGDTAKNAYSSMDNLGLRRDDDDPFVIG